MSDERTPAEERVVVLATGPVGEFETVGTYVKHSIYRRDLRCSWCGSPTRGHSAEQLALCDARYDAEIARRRAGAVRVSDVAGRS